MMRIYARPCPECGWDKFTESGIVLEMVALTPDRFALVCPACAFRSEAETPGLLNAIYAWNRIARAKGEGKEEHAKSLK